MYTNVLYDAIVVNGAIFCKRTFNTFVLVNLI